MNVSEMKDVHKLEPGEVANMTDANVLEDANYYEVMIPHRHFNLHIIYMVFGSLIRRYSRVDERWHTVTSFLRDIAILHLISDDMFERCPECGKKLGHKIGDHYHCFYCGNRWCQ